MVATVIGNSNMLSSVNRNAKPLFQIRLSLFEKKIQLIKLYSIHLNQSYTATLAIRSANMEGGSDNPT